MKEPQLGDSVHYIARDLTERAAIVTETYINGQGLLVALAILKPTGIDFRQLVQYDETGTLFDTWHWPEGVE